MKPISLVFAMLMSSLGQIYGQSFSAKTNAIFLDFKNTTTSKNTISLPIIIWKSPQQDYTNSTSNSIIIEAKIFSTTGKWLRILTGCKYRILI
jgi:hypothetical protein